MSSFLAPDGKPFYGATYLPPDIFTELLEKINATWIDEPELILNQSKELSALVTQIMQQKSDLKSLEENTIQVSEKYLLAQINAFTGGFGNAGLAADFHFEPALDHSHQFVAVVDEVFPTLSRRIDESAAGVTAPAPLRRHRRSVYGRREPVAIQELAHRSIPLPVRLSPGRRT